MEKSIENCLMNIFDAIQAKNKEDSMKLLGDAVVNAKESSYQLNNPERFNLFINSKLKNAVSILANELHKPSVCKDTHKPNFIFENYSFLERNIEKLCEMRESRSCSGDKSRYILKMYLEYSIIGVVPVYNLEREQYWKPKFGDNEMWMAFCDGLYRLHYGNPDKYFIAYKNLLECEIKKFQHTLHRWYMEFNDGEVIEFDNKWDEDIRNPLVHMDKGDFYLILKNKVLDRGYEEYVPGEDDEYLLSFYVKVPKSEIKKIYMVSEEMMV